MLLRTTFSATDPFANPKLSDAVMHPGFTVKPVARCDICDVTSAGWPNLASQASIRKRMPELFQRLFVFPVPARALQASSSSDSATSPLFCCTLHTHRYTIMYAQTFIHTHTSLHTNTHAVQTLTSELAMLNNAKVQVQREYDAFRSQATQVERNREHCNLSANPLSKGI